MVTPLAPQQLAGILPRQAVRMVQDALQAAGCPDADYDARELLRIAAGKDPRLLFDPLTRPQAECLAELAAQRMQRVPLQYLAGEWDFLGLTFKVGPGVLCPRADSEVVCETAIELLQQMGKPEPRVLDLCAGTGCLGIGIRHFVPSASVTCVEKSPQALQYLQANVHGTGVQAKAADVLQYWRELMPQSVQLIISNPPYLTGAEMQALMPETAHEPAMALDGGTDGLDFYRAIAAHYRDIVCPGGWLVFEIGCAQRADVILGPVGIAFANSMMGEISPAMAAAVSSSRAKKLLIPMTRCHVQIMGTTPAPLAAYIAEAVELLKSMPQNCP